MMDNKFNGNGGVRKAPPGVSTPEVAMTTMSAITNAGQGKSYTSASHGNLVVEGFQRLWQESLMCDTQLIVQGQTFHVHRCYLAACSQYFYSMFTKDFAEKMQAQVKLKGVTALGLRALLDYSYTGTICINDANLQDVLEAADHLQFGEILSFCADHLREELTSDNCLHFLRMAETYSLQECKRDTKAFILENFASVSLNDDFRFISFDLLCELLSDDRLKAASEMEVFKIALNWLEIQSNNNTGAYNNNNNNNIGGKSNANNNNNNGNNNNNNGTINSNKNNTNSNNKNNNSNNNNMGVCPTSSSNSEDVVKVHDLQRKVLSLIRFGLMTVEQVEYIYSHPMLKGDHCREVLHAGLSYHMKLFSQPIACEKNGGGDATSQVSRIRAYNDCLVILGAGYLDNTLCTNIMAAQIKNGALGQFVSLAQTKDRRYFAAVAVVNDFVFIVGGQTAMAGDGSHATNNAFRYNPRDGKWLQISSMSVPRTHFSLIALSNCLVAVGGKHNRVALNTAERYDFTTNEWSSIANLPHTLFSHAGCAHGSKVFISGGCPGEDFTDDVLCYDMERGGWVQKAPLNQSRGYHVMVSHANKLYVCAGNTNAGDRHDVTMTECYDVDTDDWTVLSCSSQGQSEAPAVKCDGKVFILGGYSWDAHSFQESAQCYDIETDTWQLLKNKLPEPMTGVVACRAKLPQKLFEEYPNPPPSVAT